MGGSPGRPITVGDAVAPFSSPFSRQFLSSLAQELVKGCEAGALAGRPAGWKERMEWLGGKERADCLAGAQLAYTFWEYAGYLVFSIVPRTSPPASPGASVLRHPRNCRRWRNELPRRMRCENARMRRMRRRM